MKDNNLNKDTITTKEMTFDEIDSKIKELSVRKSLLVDESLQSNDVHEIIKAQDYLVKQGKAKQSQFKSFVYSPEHEFYNGMGYKSSLKSISYDLMRAMARTPQINAIIQTRIEQVLNFSEFQTDLQRGGWTIVKKLSRFDDHSNYELQDKDKKEIDCIVNFLENGGDNAKWDLADDFDEFLRKYVKDSLELDQAVMEIERTRGGKIYRYAAKPSETYRILETIDPNEFNKEKYRYDEVNGHLPIYAQVWRGRIAEREIPGTNQKEQIVFYPWELNFGVRNKSTYIRNNGYGKSELEILVEIITWMLYGMQYNGNFFCISEDSRIVTDLGIKNIKSLVDVDSFQVFDGVEWSKAKAYKTRFDDLFETRLFNGLKLKTSKEHNFLVLREGDVEPIWVTQSDLQLGDYCMVEINSHNYFNKEDFYIDKRYYREFTNPTKEVIIKKPNTFTPTIKMVEDEDFWEMIGFAIGDGSWQEHMLQIFPHWKKDKDVFDKFLNVCKKYNISIKVRDMNKKITRGDGEKGYPAIFIYHTTFLDWLLDIGFKYSKDKKRIPTSVFNLPDNLKGAFLRGWFSADGHSQKNVYGYKTPSLCCVDDNLRQDGLQLLLSLGVAAKEKIGNGKYKGKFIHIYIQDVLSFVDKVGYIQDYKNEGIYRNKSTRGKWDLLPNSLALNILENNKGRTFAEPRYRIRQGGRISRYKLINKLLSVGAELPSILNYHFIKVIDVGKESISKEQLYDIEVFNDKHIFLSNFVSVHNSQGSNPKGFFTIEGDADKDVVNEFRSAWRQTIAGIGNSHRTPIFEGQSKISWVDMHVNNKDMEFENWNDFLLLIACSVYRIDPQEIGYTFKSKNQTLGEKNQKQRIEHSKEKGLKPLLKFVQKQINKYLVSELNPAYEFKFTGIDLKDETTMLDNDVKKTTAGFVSHEDMFEKYSNRKFNPEKDTILSPIFVQMQQLKAFGGIDSNAAVDEMTGDKKDPPNPNENYEKGENPIMDASLDYIQKNLMS